MVTKKNRNKSCKNKSRKNKSCKNKSCKNKKNIRKSRKGGDKSSDGFILEVDEDGIPINNSLDYENAELFIKNFLFTDNYIKYYLEPTKEDIAVLFSLNYIDFTKIYSGDETKLNDLIEHYMQTYPQLFLKIFEIIDPISQKEFIKNLYKSDTKNPNINSPYRPEISVSSGGVKEEKKAKKEPSAASSYSHKFPSMPSLDDELEDIPLDEDEIQPAPAPAAAAAALTPTSINIDDEYVFASAPSSVYIPKKKNNLINGICLSIFALFKPAAKKIIIREKTEVVAPVPAVPVPVPVPVPAVPAVPVPAVPDVIISKTLSLSDRRHVITFNFVNRIKQFICKLTVKPGYLLNYKREFSIYESLRKTLLEQHENPNTRLENFFRWQNEKEPFLSTSIPIYVNLNLTYDDIPIYKEINLVDNVNNLHTDVANNIVPIIDNKLEWGSLNGIYNPNHVDLSRIIKNVSYTNINSNLSKLKIGLTFIFNNLYFFYIRTGFLHCDFKTDNILVETNDSITAITNSYMFDLDISLQLPAYMYTYDPSIDIKRNRKILDNLIVPSIVNSYLKIASSIKTEVSVGFLHFFDCYMAAVTLIADANRSGKLILIDAVVNDLTWNSEDPYHSINIFKTTYDFIRLSGIVSPHLGLEHWYQLKFDNILEVMYPKTQIKELFNTFSVQKKTTYKWIIYYLMNK